MSDGFPSSPLLHSYYCMRVFVSPNPLQYLALPFFFIIDTQLSMGFTEKKKKAEARIYPAGHSLLNHALQKRNKLLYSHEILYTNIHASFIYNSQKLKPTHMLCNVFVVKQAVIYPYNGLSNKRKTLNH